MSDTDIPGTFPSPTDLKHNRGLIADPTAFAKDAGAASWLYMCGEEFASMEGGMSYADVQAAVPDSVNLIADPPREFDMDVARRGVAALDELPRPTLVTCRTGPRSSALVYLYSGLQVRSVGRRGAREGGGGWRSVHPGRASEGVGCAGAGRAVVTQGCVLRGVDVLV